MKTDKARILIRYVCEFLQARPLFRNRKKFSLMADPMLEGGYPMRGLYQALAIAAMCVQEQPNMRPAIADVVTALSYLSSQQQSSSFKNNYQEQRGHKHSSQTAHGGMTKLVEG